MEPDRRYRKTATHQNELQLANGLQGVADTLQYMNQAVSAYKTNPQIRELSLSLTRNLPQKDYAGEVKALFNYVQKRIRYVRDINGVETLQTPPKTLEYGQGDCDDKSMLLATMLESLGHKTRFKAIGMARGSLSHVSVEVMLNGRWVNLETTEPVALGWAPPHYVEEMTSDNLDGLFSKVWGGIKGAARGWDKFALHLPGVQQVKGVADKIVVSKAGQAVGTVLSFIPATSYIGYAIKIAGTVKKVNASESAGRKIQNTLALQAKGDAAAAAQLANTRYVMDITTNQIREATATDVGQQQFVLDAATGQLVPASAAAISATVPGSTVALAQTAYPLPYASGGYPAQQAQVLFQSPAGGLTTTNPVTNSSTNAAIKAAVPWGAVAVIGGIGLLLVMRSRQNAHA